MKSMTQRFLILVCACAGAFASFGDDFVEIVPWIKSTRKQAVQTDWIPPNKNNIWFTMNASMSGDYDSNGGGKVFFGATDSNQNANRGCWKFYFDSQYIIRGDTRYEYLLTGGKNANITCANENLRNVSEFSFWPTAFRWKSATETKQASPDTHNFAGVQPVSLFGGTEYDGSVTPFTCYDMFFYGLTISEDTQANVVRTYKPAKRGSVYGIWESNNVTGVTRFLPSMTGVPFEGPGPETITIDGTNYVYLVKNSFSKEAFGTTAEAGLCWSDNQPPAATNHYLIADRLLLTCNAKATFPGGSLMIGSETSDGFIEHTFNDSITYTKLVCRRGSYSALVLNGAAYINAPIHILSKADRPFNFKGRTSSDYYYGMRPLNQIIGTKDTVFRLASYDPDLPVKKEFRFTIYNKTNSGGGDLYTFDRYFGRILLDGNNVRFFGFPKDTTGKYMLGNDTGEYRADGLIIRNGAVYYLDEYRTWYNFRNSGILCESGDCFLGVRPGTAQGVNVPITGNGRVLPGGRGWNETDWSNTPFFFTTNVACAALVLSNSVPVICGENVQFGEDTVIDMYSGSFSTPSRGLRQRMIYRGGTIRLGTGNRTQRSLNGISITRTADPDLGTFEFATGSQILTLPIKVELESTMMYTTTGDYLLLKIPTSVQVVMPSDIAIPGYNVTVQTLNGMQYVSLGDPVGDNMVAYVVPEGTPGNTPTSPYSSWATAANSIQKAINVISAGGTVRVKSGLYSLTSQLTIPVRMILTSDDGLGNLAPETTILDGRGQNAILTLQNNAAGSAFRGFTFQNGKSGSSGIGSAITINDVSSQPLLIDRCRFLSNVGTAGDRCAAIVCGGTWCFATIRQCSFKANLAAGTGAGIASQQNQASSDWGLRGKPFIERCDFNCNTSKCGAAYLLSQSSITGSVFRANVGTSGAGAMDGGSSVLCQDNIFLGNTGTGYAAFGTFTSTRCTIVGNQGANLIPNSMYCCVVSNNTATGPCIPSSRIPTLQNTLLASNYIAGAFIDFYNNGTYKGTRLFENCTFANNYFGKHYNDTANLDPNSFFVSVVNCIFRENVIGQQQTVPTVPNRPTFSGDYNVADDQFVLDYTNPDHRWTFDPRFVDPIHGNYRLSPYSHACDIAEMLPWMTDSAVDLGGNPRRVNPRGRATPDAIPDLGCFECVTRSIGLIIKIR